MKKNGDKIELSMEEFQALLSPKNVQDALELERRSTIEKVIVLLREHSRLAAKAGYTAEDFIDRFCYILRQLST